MIEMFTMNATDVRKNWSEISEKAIREKPQFIKKTRDYMMLSSMEFINELLSDYTFSAEEYKERDGSITLSLNELDLVENAATEEEAVSALSEAILEYAVDFYKEFNLWSTDSNRKKEIPYVFKALVLDDAKNIGECIKCRAGKS